jgi:hypothetical protein
MNPEIEKWRNALSDPRKWMPNDPHVVWVLRYNDVRVLVTKMSASVMIEVDGYVKRMDFLDNRTPEGLLEVLDREVLLAYAATVHLS